MLLVVVAVAVVVAIAEPGYCAAIHLVGPSPPPPPPPLPPQLLLLLFSRSPMRVPKVFCVRCCAQEPMLHVVSVTQDDVLVNFSSSFLAVIYRKHSQCMPE